MIARLLRAATILFLYFCAASLLAQVIILGYLWGTWQLNREKLVQMLAIAQGIDLFAAQERAQAEGQVPPEEPSYEDWLARRSTLFRDLELREQALDNALARLRADQQQAAADRQAAEKIRADFEARLLALQQGAEAEGRQSVARILESLKPKQAKEQILAMLDNNEIDDVVQILAGMTESKRAKILAEFHPEEDQKIAEVLRLIRQGEPTASLVDKARSKLPAGAMTGKY